MAVNLSGQIAAANVSQVLFALPKHPISFNGYQVQNTSAAILYIEDSGAAATTASMQVAAGGTYTSPPGCLPAKGVQIMGGTLNQTFVAKQY